MSRSISLPIAIAFFMVSAGAVAAQSRLIPFQARLTDGSGAPVADGVYPITFSIYDAATGGTAIWSEPHPSASVVSGQVNVILGALISFDDPAGDGSVAPVEFSADKFLGISIGGGGEMVPRHQLLPAFHARSTDDADLLDGIDSSGFEPVLPTGALLYFDLGSCPSGWSPHTSAQGRGLVAGHLAGSALVEPPGTPIGTSLAPSEISSGLGRAVGQHSHTSSAAGIHAHNMQDEGGHTHQYEYWTFLGPELSPGNQAAARTPTQGTTEEAGVHQHVIDPAAAHSHTIDSAGSTPGTNAPGLIALLCRKD